METDSSGYHIHESRTVDSITIPADIVEALEALPRSGPKPWEPWMDEVIKKYWQSRSQEDVAKIIDMPVKRCRKRARELGL